MPYPSSVCHDPAQYIIPELALYILPQLSTSYPSSVHHTRALHIIHHVRYGPSVQYCATLSSRMALRDILVEGAALRDTEHENPAPAQGATGRAVQS
eukprot:3104700-Rhodomonas_salina.1